jgi:hypothetical protein
MNHPPLAFSTIKSVWWLTTSMHYPTSPHSFLIVGLMEDRVVDIRPELLRGEGAKI